MKGDRKSMKNFVYTLTTLTSKNRGYSFTYDLQLVEIYSCKCFCENSTDHLWMNKFFTHTDAPVPPLYLGKQVQKPRDDHNQKTGSHTPIRWNQFDIRDTILKFLKCSKQCVYCVPCGWKFL